MNNKYLMSVVEASKYFNVGRDKLYALIRSQEDIPVLKVGETTKINVPMFAEWLNKATLEGREL